MPLLEPIPGLGLSKAIAFHASSLVPFFCASFSFAYQLSFRSVISGLSGQLLDLSIPGY